MNTNDYVFYGKCLVDGALALVTLGIAVGIGWMIHEAIKDPEDFFGIK